MALAYYFDHNVPRAISEGLALRGIDVLTCLADATEALEDAQVLNRATELERVLLPHRKSTGAGLSISRERSFGLPIDFV